MATLAFDGPLGSIWFGTASDAAMLAEMCVEHSVTHKITACDLAESQETAEMYGVIWQPVQSAKQGGTTI